MRHKGQRALVAVTLLGIWMFYYSFDNLKNFYNQRFVQPHQVEIIEWICLPRHTVNNMCHPPRNRLLAYKAISSRKEIVKGQIVEFIADDIPKHYKVLSNHTAIFHLYEIEYYPWNLFHFVTNYYVPFHHLLNVWKSLNLTVESHIYFSKSLLDRCRKERFPSFFLPALGNTATATYGYNYHAHPGNVCYRNGLFSDDLYLDKTQSASEHLRKVYGVEQKPCPTQNNILLLQRDVSRIWLNIKNVQRALMEAGYTNTSIASFDKMPLKKQLRTAYCTDAFIAPVSAGFEWAYFMKPHSTAIEIMWSRYGWPPFYTNLHSSLKVPLNLIPMETENVTGLAYSVQRVIMEDPFYVEQSLAHLRFNKYLTETQLRTMYFIPFLGKYCNFSVDPQRIVYAIKKSVKLSL